MRSLPLLALASMLALSGCISFAAKPPPSLLTLQSAAGPVPGQPQSSADAKTISITIPAVGQVLATLRVPVQATDTSVAYIKDAQWAEPPNRQFARVLSDTIAARTGRVVIGGVPAAGNAGAQLSGDLRSFGIVAASNEAVVTFDAALARDGSEAVEKQRFEARVPVAAIDAANAGVALNQAANQVAAQVAEWVGR